MATVKQKSGARTLTISRIFDAPRELVWQAWTEPERAKQWFGPKGYTAPVVKINLRVGGKYLSCMRSPDGKDIWGVSVFREIVKPERLVMTDSFADKKGKPVPASYYGLSGDWSKEVLIRVALAESAGKTKVTLTHSGMSGLSDPDFEGMKQGWSEMFDKLAEYLKSEQTRSTNMVSFSSIMIGSAKPKVMGEFYEKVFGKPSEMDEDGWYGWKTGNGWFTIGEHSEVKGKAKEPQRIILNFETKEVKKEFTRIKKAGATVIKEPYELEGAWIATLADPDGNYFQLMTPMEM